MNYEEQCQQQESLDEAMEGLHHHQMLLAQEEEESALDDCFVPDLTLSQLASEMGAIDEYYETKAEVLHKNQLSVDSKDTSKA